MLALRLTTALGQNAKYSPRRCFQLYLRQRTSGGGTAMTVSCHKRSSYFYFGIGTAPEAGQG